MTSPSIANLPVAKIKIDRRRGTAWWQRAQHQTVEQRRIPAMAHVMQFELLPRPACLTAVLGAQQRVAANNGTEFTAHSRGLAIGRYAGRRGQRYTLLAHVAVRYGRAGIIGSRLTPRAVTKFRHLWRNAFDHDWRACGRAISTQITASRDPV